MMNDAYDVIVIGAGHNGLVTAAYLARAGLRVLALERRDAVGGAALTREVFPGFRFESAAHRVNWLHPMLARDLRSALDRAEAGGLSQTYGRAELVDSDPTVFTPLADGRHLTLWREPARSIEAVRRFSEADAENWNAFAALVSKACGLLGELYQDAPPDVLSRKGSELWELLRLGRAFRRLGKREMMEVTRILPMTIRELLDEWFETDVLKGTLGAAGITGLSQGPMGGGTALMFLHQHVGAAQGVFRGFQLVRGGIGNLINALEAFALESGAEIRKNAAVERIAVKEGRAVAVVLADGNELAARRIVSSLDPKRTFLQLLDPTTLDPNFLHAVRNVRMKGVCAKVNLALSELPDFSCLPGDGPHLRGLISVSPNLRYLERAYDDAKYGRISAEPYLEAFIPSLHDAGMAPPGQHVMSILAQYAPYHLKSGAWDDAMRTELGDSVVKTLAVYAPNIETAILHRQVFSPLDLEAEFGLTEGNIYHGEMTLDQLFVMRPVPGWARYRTPIANLFLCGAGAHPGGGVTGAPGFNAARQILKDGVASQ
ncbi:MAG: NAD(P)/FAD-dependent oxidoreductase [Gemmatimonadales bacterium]|jgi:phytoene dehydrogenase-like protein